MKFQKAKSNLKKFKVIYIIINLLMVMISIALIWIVSPWAAFLSIVVFFIIRSFIANILQNKYIFSPLNNDLDAPLFYEIVKQGKYFTRTADYQIHAEYHSGNYENVILTCEEKLKDKKLKKSRVWYLSYLAACYFDIGDLDALSAVCEQYKAELSALSPSRANKVKTKFQTFDFYDRFLAKDFEGCRAQSSPGQAPLTEVRNDFKNARIALAIGDNEGARTLFEKVIDRAPEIYCSALAKYGIDSIEKHIDYKDAIPPLDLSHAPVIFSPTKYSKVLKVIRNVLIVVMIIVLAASSLAHLKDQADYKKELAEYFEKIRIAVEEEHDGVEILDSFNITSNGKEDGAVIDVCYIAKTDKGLILGYLYQYAGDDKIYSKTAYVLSNTDVTEQPMTFEFNSIVSTCHIEGGVFSSPNDIPESYHQMNQVKVGDTTYYFVITCVYME